MLNSKTKQLFRGIKGTRSSLTTNNLLISSGISAVDSSLGGGIAVGTVTLIEEDQYGTFSEAMLKCYLSEGVLAKHHLFISSALPTAQQLTQELPAPADNRSHFNCSAPTHNVMGRPSQSGDSAEDLKIAWRYQNLAQEDRSTVQYGQCFDLTKYLSEDDLSKTSVTLFQPMKDTSCTKQTEDLLPVHKQLLIDLKNVITSDTFSTNTEVTAKRNVLRIGIHSLGSTLWSDDKKHHDETDLVISLCRFFYVLRSIVRSALASCLVTVPTHLFENSMLRTRLQHLSDTTIQLDSFAATANEQHSFYKNYQGLLHISKIPLLYSLSASNKSNTEYVFKVKNGRFIFEKPHLPPVFQSENNSLTDIKKKQLDHHDSVL